ncbi:uncharacterized protein LOC119681510 [Teleopsis dalmanni]|uniref:uncharacterized protein LOC119681510 n=1 Tax=Teleopsis dalmanni TaxID=139649 RepID=UPI0018CECAB4|nr:uncharacterized protein LOC119681510 [Teleopsis dalmanni]XP_037950652.1 uncharacterized protein LOC119681510 [Teleopsis dalmanni]
MTRIVKLLFLLVSAVLVLNCVSARRISYESKGVHSSARSHNRMARGAGEIEHLGSNGNGKGNIEFLGAVKSSPEELLSRNVAIEMLADDDEYVDNEEYITYAEYGGDEDDADD